MSLSDTRRRAGAPARPRPLLNLRPALIGAAALFVFVAAARLYEQAFGWSAGLDSFAPEFQTYWTRLLLTAAPLGLAAAAGLVGYLWRTRDRAMAALAPSIEMRRILYLVQWLLVFALALYWGLSFFMEQTAVWHMTAVRDTDFTPSNIVTFYISYPLFAIIGLGAFFYAKTRLPIFARGYSLALLVLVGGAFMLIPNVGFNEWGHTSWSMEEGFAGPLHWGFVFFGWMSLGVFGVTLQMLGRMRELLGAQGVDARLRRD